MLKNEGIYLIHQKCNDDKEGHVLNPGKFKNGRQRGSIPIEKKLNFLIKILL